MSKTKPPLLERQNPVTILSTTMAATRANNLPEDSTRPSKQVKTATSDANQPPQFAEQDLAESNGQDIRPVSIPNSADQILPRQLQHLNGRYDFVTMSIVSSARIEQKVRSLLSHLARFSFADPKAKPGVVILHAKASVAGKMISVIEIAKRNIEKERGKWWQYSSVHGEITELKEKMTKAPHSRKTLLEWEKEQKDGAEGGTGEVQEVTKESTTAHEPHPAEEEDAFETMGQGDPNNGVISIEETEPRKKLRSVPIMTVYMSRVPLAELKQAFGYVD